MNWRKLWFYIPVILILWTILLLNYNSITQYFIVGYWVVHYAPLNYIGRSPDGYLEFKLNHTFFWWVPKGDPISTGVWEYEGNGDYHLSTGDEVRFNWITEILYFYPRHGDVIIRYEFERVILPPFQPRSLCDLSGRIGYNVAATARQYGDDIVVTWQGGEHNPCVQYYNITIRSSDGTIYKSTFLPPLVANSTLVKGSGTSGQDHVVVVATFINRDEQVILDSYV